MTDDIAALVLKNIHLDRVKFSYYMRDAYNLIPHIADAYENLGEESRNLTLIRRILDYDGIGILNTEEIEHYDMTIDKDTSEGKVLNAFLQFLFELTLDQRKVLFNIIYGYWGFDYLDNEESFEKYKTMMKELRKFRGETPCVCCNCGKVFDWSKEFDKSGVKSEEVGFDYSLYYGFTVLQPRHQQKCCDCLCKECNDTFNIE